MVDTRSTTWEYLKYGILRLLKNYDLLKEALYCRTIIFFAISSPTIFHKLGPNKTHVTKQEMVWCRRHKSTDHFRFLYWIALAHLPMKISLAVFVTLRYKVFVSWQWTRLYWHGFPTRFRLCRKGSQAVSFFPFWIWVTATAGTFGYCQYGQVTRISLACHQATWPQRLILKMNIPSKCFACPSVLQLSCSIPFQGQYNSHRMVLSGWRAHDWNVETWENSFKNCRSLGFGEKKISCPWRE